MRGALAITQIVFEKSLERGFVGFGVPPSGGSTPRPPEGGTPNGIFSNELSDCSVPLINRNNPMKTITIIALAAFVSVIAATTTHAQDWAKARLEKSPRHQ